MFRHIPCLGPELCSFSGRGILAFVEILMETDTNEMER